jgi:hypothetical protein
MSKIFTIDVQSASLTIVAIVNVEAFARSDVRDVSREN